MYDNEIKELREQFRRSFPLSDYIILEHFKDLKKIEDDVYDKMKNEIDFNGIDFCDFDKNNIKVRIFHKKVPYFAILENVSINSDFSNKDDIADEVFTVYKKFNAQHIVELYKKFLFKNGKLTDVYAALNN